MISFFYNITEAASRYKPLVNDLDTVAQRLTGKSLPIDIQSLINFLFYVGLAVIVVLAVFGIVRGGYLYLVSADSASNKDKAKKVIQAALGGLLLGFGSWLILNTINPDILKFDPEYEQLDAPPVEEIDIGTLPNDGMSQEQMAEILRNLPSGTFSGWTEQQIQEYLYSLPSMPRSTDGRLIFSTYRSIGDSTPDRLTTLGYGNRNNLLIPGSVALSPDLIRRYNPLPGQEIFVNGYSVGFYDDTTASSYRGTAIVNTIDIYDPNNNIGNQLRGLPAGQWHINLGNVIRPQTPHPNN